MGHRRARCLSRLQAVTDRCEISAPRWPPRLELRGGDPSSCPRSSGRPRPEFGDYSTNAAMLLAPIAGRAAARDRRAAGRGADRAAGRRRSSASRWPGPGFLNLFMADAWLSGRGGRCAGGGRAATAPGRDGERVNVEFVSANPTGPITVASGRHAAYGDALCRILEFAGNEVEREYYVNDYGTPDPALRRVDPRAGAGRGAARGRLPGRLRGRAGATGSTAPPSWTPTSSRSRGVELMLGERARHARALPGAHGPLRSERAR